MEKDQILYLIDKFLKENEMWTDFDDWLYNNGYHPEDLGFEEENV